MVLPQGAAALAPLLVVEHLNHGEIVEEEGTLLSRVERRRRPCHLKRERGEGENSLL